jgi:pseudouridine synthase
LFPVGRLEWDAQGLVLLTTDGEFAQRLTHPRYAVPKVYRVQVKGEIAPERVEDLQAAVKRQAKLAMKRDAAMRRKAAKEAAGGGPLAIGAGGGGVGRRKELFVPPTVRLLEKERPEWNEQRESQGATLEVTQIEARGVPLRDILFAVGLPVRRLTRVGVGGLRLGALKVGDWRELSGEEVRELLETPAWDGSASVVAETAQELRDVARKAAQDRGPARQSRAASDRPTQGMSERAFKDKQRRKALREMDRSSAGERGPAGGGAERGGRGGGPGPKRSARPERSARSGGAPRASRPAERKGPRTILPE